MAFAVKMWTFSKKYNSTAIPSGTATTYNCTLKDNCSTMEPAIEIGLAMSTKPVQNYAFIASFSRYYWIRDWKFEFGTWTAYMECDVLASYKTAIGSSSLYVLRAASDYDGTIIDEKYPCKTGCTYSSTSLTSPYDNTGCYVLGISNQKAYFGSVTYFVMDRTNMGNLYSGLLSVVGTGTTPANGFNFDDASKELQLSLVNPLQYIKSCVWLPVSSTNITTDLTATSIKVFDWTISGVTGKRLSNPQIILRGLNGIALSDHPQAATRGAYMNCEPYTLLNLLIPPFGVIPIDTSVSCNASDIDADIYIDAMTGYGSLEISCNGIVLNKIDAQVGVPVQLSQITRDYNSAAAGIGSAIGSIANAVVNKDAASIAGGIGAGIGAIANAQSSVKARVNSVGSNGSFSQITGRNPEINYQWFTAVDDDLTHNGRPLCQMKTINTLSGYILVQDGDISASCTKEEGEKIKTFLETGFYYE